MHISSCILKTMTGLVLFSRTFIIQRPQQTSLIWALIVTRPTWLLPPRKVPPSCGITVSSTRTAVFLVQWIITHYTAVVTSLKGKSGLLTTGSQRPLNNQDTSGACSMLGLIDIDSLTHVSFPFFHVEDSQIYAHSFQLFLFSTDRVDKSRLESSIFWSKITFFSCRGLKSLSSF